MDGDENGRGGGGGEVGDGTYGLAEDACIVADTCSVDAYFGTSVIDTRVAEGEKGVFDEFAGGKREGGGVCGGDAELEGVEVGGLCEECAGLGGDEMGETGGARVRVSGDDGRGLIRERRTPRD